MGSITILIPARSGSTRVKNKNLQKIGGISLLEKKIKICKSLKIGKVVVSTNSKKIAKLSSNAGQKFLFYDQKNIQRQRPQQYQQYYITLDF